MFFCCQHLSTLEFFLGINCLGRCFFFSQTSRGPFRTPRFQFSSETQPPIPDAFCLLCLDFQPGLCSSIGPVSSLILPVFNSWALLRFHFLDNSALIGRWGFFVPATTPSLGFFLGRFSSKLTATLADPSSFFCGRQHGLGVFFPLHLPLSTRHHPPCLPGFFFFPPLFFFWETPPSKFYLQQSFFTSLAGNPPALLLILFRSTSFFRLCPLVGSRYRFVFWGWRFFNSVPSFNLFNPNEPQTHFLFGVSVVEHAPFFFGTSLNSFLR